MGFDGRTPGPWESYSADADVLAAVDALGHVTRTFGRTYSTPPAVTGTGRNEEQVTIHAVTQTSATFEFRTASGALIVAPSAVRFDWIALPATV